MASLDRKPQSTVDPEEVARFAAMADEWWDPRGKMKPLHKFNPIRLAYIRDHACAHFSRDAKSLDCLKALRILDVGCGGGILSEPLARLGADVVGIDPAPENAAAARMHAEKSGLKIDYRATTVEEMAAAGEQFDIVIATEVVEHVTDVDLFVRRCAETVKPSGFMVATTINRTVKSFALAIVGAEYVLRWLPVGTHDWKKFITPDELEAALKAAGMIVTDETGVIYNPLNDEWRKSDDMDVNYMLLAQKKLVIA